MTRAITLLCLLLLSAPVWGANPPTNYTLQTTPYNGSESWYCEDVTNVADRRCTSSGLFASITSLANLTTAPLLASVGTLSSGAIAGAGFTVNASTVTWLGSLAYAQLPTCYSTMIVPISCGGNGDASPGITAGRGITIDGNWPRQRVSYVPGMWINTDVGNPAGTSNVSGVMMGLNVTFRPVSSGIVMITITGVAQTTETHSACYYTLSIGSDSPPANGAGATGLRLAQAINTSPLISEFGGLYNVPFSVSGATSLTVGVVYWVDLIVSSSNPSVTCAPVQLHVAGLES